MFFFFNVHYKSSLTAEQSFWILPAHFHKWCWIQVNLNWHTQRHLHMPVQFHLVMDMHSWTWKVFFRKLRTCYKFLGVPVLWLFPWLQSQIFTWEKLAQSWHKQHMKRLENRERRRETEVSDLRFYLISSVTWNTHLCRGHGQTDSPVFTWAC